VALVAVPVVLAIGGAAAMTALAASPPHPSPTNSSPAQAVEPAAPSETSSAAEPAAAPGAPDTGHADAAGNVDYQFEGQQ
jgi:hypothetical protein